MYPSLRKHHIFKTVHPTFDEINDELNQVTEDIAKMEAQFGGRAFLVFKVQSDVENVIDYYGQNTTQAQFGRVV